MIAAPNVPNRSVPNAEHRFIRRRLEKDQSSIPFAWEPFISATRLCRSVNCGFARRNTGSPILVPFPTSKSNPPSALVVALVATLDVRFGPRADIEALGQTPSLAQAELSRGAYELGQKPVWFGHRFVSTPNDILIGANECQVAFIKVACLCVSNVEDL